MKDEKERYEHMASILLYIDLDKVWGEGGQSDYRFTVRAWNLEQFMESQKKGAKKAKKAK